MHRDAHRARLVGDGTGDGLADPPGGVGGELEPLAPVELLDGADQTEVALLDEVEEVDTRGVGIAAGVCHHQTQVGGEEGVLGLLAVTGLAAELELLLLALVITAFETCRGLLAAFDLLRKLDLLLRCEQVVFADGGEVLADQVCGQTTTLIGQLAALTLAVPIAPCFERGVRTRRVG